MLFHPAPGCGRVKITRHNHGHVACHIVGLVVIPENLIRGSHDDLFCADGQVIGQSGAGGCLAEHGNAGAVAGGVAGIELALHNASLVVNGAVLQGGAIGKIAHDGEGKIHRFLIQIRQVQHVDRVQQACVGVCIAAKPQPHLLHGGNELTAFETAGAIEYQMFQQVGNSFFVLLFIQRTHVHEQADTGAPLGLCRGADDVAHAVGQFSFYQLRVFLQLCKSYAFCCYRSGSCRLLGAEQGNTQTEQYNREKGMVFHIKML